MRNKLDLWTTVSSSVQSTEQSKGRNSNSRALPFPLIPLMPYPSPSCYVADLTSAFPRHCQGHEYVYADFRGECAGAECCVQVCAGKVKICRKAVTFVTL